MEILITDHRGIVGLGRVPASSPGWTTPLRGTRVAGDVPLTHRLMAQAATSVSSRRAVACDLTAAHLWAMFVPSGFGLSVDAQACAIATVRDGSRHRSGGVRGRRLELPPEHVTVLEGTPITTPARTWLDCAALVRWPDVVAMGDAMIRGGLATLEDLEAVVDWGRGRRGIRFARAALTVIDPAAESPGESWVRAMLVKAGVPRPVCNHTVTIGGLTFRLDIAWPEVMLAVEYDGEEHHGPEHREHDEWRRALLARAGWTIIVVRKGDLSGMDRLAALVKDASHA